MQFTLCSSCCFPIEVRNAAQNELPSSYHSPEVCCKPSVPDRPRLPAPAWPYPSSHTLASGRWNHGHIKTVCREEKYFYLQKHTRIRGRGDNKFAKAPTRGQFWVARSSFSYSGGSEKLRAGLVLASAIWQSWRAIRQSSMGTVPSCGSSGAHSPPADPKLSGVAVEPTPVPAWVLGWGHHMVPQGWRGCKGVSRST